MPSICYVVHIQREERNHEVLFIYKIKLQHPIQIRDARAHSANDCVGPTKPIESSQFLYDFYSNCLKLIDIEIMLRMSSCTASDFED